MNPSKDTIWTEAQAERQLRSLELFGMRFGLDRMRRMMTVLGSPEQRFDAVHVLGTNGKSSTTRMAAAILECHGLRTAAYLSPHLVSYRERVLIDGRELDTEAFASAIARASWAAERVNRTLAEDDHVTQFELLTAAALWEMARQEIDVAVIEAGLGGRYDATSVIDAPVSVLTNVGLEHTRWLGPTVRDIAEEKLAAVRTRATLVLGEALASPALEVAERVAREREARVLHAESASAVPELLARGAFQRRNFALARCAAGAYLQQAGIALDEHAVAQAAASTAVPGRLQRVARDPLTIVDGAHNPDAVIALVQSLPDVFPAGPLALVLGVLDDKDAASMLAALLPVTERAWFTAPPSNRALSPAALQSLARQLGFDASVSEPRASRALEQAQAWASAHGGSVLATGSVYLVGDLIGGLAGAETSPGLRMGPESSAR
ncbi:MAG TPA: cyanophycin synthetase [Solirubrobacteraceae bacterium]|jgi:dihydrofolate synthase/folylpolyglutamate synthase|nr:cyanophycin synthetase [Solirubrobacteraceae bacterium]